MLQSQNTPVIPYLSREMYFIFSFLFVFHSDERDLHNGSASVHRSSTRWGWSVSFNRKQSPALWISINTNWKAKTTTKNNDLLALHVSTHITHTHWHVHTHVCAAAACLVFLTCLPPCVQSPCCSTGKPSFVEGAELPHQVSQNH